MAQLLRLAGGRISGRGWKKLANLVTNPWIEYIGTALIVVATAELGRLLGLWWRRRRPNVPGLDLATLQGAGLSLLALMIGFTFAMTLGRHDARLRGVLDEANAIGTTSLRAGMLPEPYSGEVRKLIGDYVQLRTELIRGPADQAVLDQVVRRSAQMQAELWRHAIAATTADPHSIAAGLFATSLNQMIDLQEVRLAAARNRVPPAVFALLYGIAMVAVGFNGYVAGLAGGAGRIPSAIMAAMLATVIAMVADIDRSQSGFITVGQQPLVNLQESLGR
jgi:hypothetical protein